jgi:predicted amidohydrolase YtcJ
VEEAIDSMTVHAAAMLGMEKSMGMIEKGRVADFTVFAENPLEKDLNGFADMHAVMTVVNGEIVTQI